LQQAPTLSTTEVEQALDAVLSRPAYVPAEPPLLYRFFRAVADWFGDTVWPFLARFAPDPDWSNPGWATLGTVLLGLGALLGVALLVYLAALGVRAWRRRGRPGASASPDAPSGPASAPEWEALAAAAAARADWREAAQALYQAVILRLGEAGTVRVDGAKTPGDYRREVRRGAADVFPRLEAFLGWFERVAYGRSEPGPDQYDRLRTTAAALGSGG
jgi:hypothetical protein